MKRRNRFLLIGCVLIVIIAAAIASLFFLLGPPILKSEKITIDNSNIVQGDGLQILCDQESDFQIKSQNEAYEYLDYVSDYLSIDNPKSNLCFISQEEIDSYIIYNFQQVKNDRPVYGRNIILRYDPNENSKLISDGALPLEEVSNEDTDLDESKIDEIISRQYNSSNYRIGGEVYFPTDSELYLTTQVNVYTDEDQKLVFISHEDETIIKELSLVYTQRVNGYGQDLEGNSREFPTELTDSEYLLYDQNNDIQAYDAHNSTVLSDPRKSQVILDSRGNIYRWEKKGDFLQDDSGNRYTVNCGPNNYLILKNENGTVHDEKATFGMWLSSKNPFINISEITNNTTKWKDKKAVTAYSNVQVCNDFWKSIMKRDGFNNKSGRVNLVINDYKGGDTTNAYSSSGGFIIENGYRVDIPITLLSFGSDNSLTLDMIAHEYMHSVERSISGLNYEGESGAIMDAYSDLFGEIVEDWNDNRKLDGSCNWNHSGIRSLSDPNSTSLPSEYKGRYWHDTSNPSDSNDHGGVHTNNTVISRAAYLMFTGVNNSPAYDSLSTQEIAELFYKTLYLIPNSDCTFKQLRYLIEQQAILNGLSQRQRDCISNAFFQVGITLTKNERIAFENQQKNIDDLNEIDSNLDKQSLEETFNLPLTFMTRGSHWGTKVGITGNYWGGIEHNYTHYQTPDKRVTDVAAYDITTESKYSSKDQAWIITVTDTINWSPKICEDRNQTSEIECVPVDLDSVESAPSIFDELYLYPKGTKVSEMLKDCSDDLLVHYPNANIISNGILQNEVLYNKNKDIFYYNLGDTENSVSTSETIESDIKQTIEVSSYKDLQNINNNLLANYVLVNDIDCQGQPLEPIGSDLNPFSGTFEGNGYTISNFRIHFVTPDMPTEQNFDIGFFGKIKNASIKGLNLDDCVISAVGSKTTGIHFVNVGALIGLAESSTIVDCNARGLIVNNTEEGYYNRASGLCCIAIEETQINHCSFEGSVQFSSLDFNTMIAGITSWLNNSSIDNCIANIQCANVGTSSLLYLSGISASGENSSVKNCKVVSTLQELEALEADYFDKISNFSAIQDCEFTEQ